MLNNLPQKVYIFVPDWHHLYRLKEALLRLLWHGVAIERLSGVKDASEILGNPHNMTPIVIYDSEGRLAQLIQNTKLTKRVIFILGDINPFKSVPSLVTMLDFSELRQDPESLVSSLSRK